MNPYYDELKLKYLKKEISLDLYQKTLTLIQQLEEKNKNSKDKTLTDKTLTDKNKTQKDKMNVNNVYVNAKEKEKEKQREKEKAFIEEQQKIRQEHQKKVKMYIDLLKTPTLAKTKQKEFLYKLSKMNQQEKLTFLSNLAVIKEFSNEHNHSDKVVLLEGFIVRKHCQIDSFGNYMFQNEIRALSKVSPYPHFPILVAYDPYNLIIYMTYCGETLDISNIPLNWKLQFDEISEILEVLGVNSNDMLLRNTCVFNGEISIIDFGLATQFGRDLHTVLKEFYLRLSSINNINNINNIKRKVLDNSVENNYNNDYPEWKLRLQKIKEVKKYLEKVKVEVKMKKKGKS